VTQPVLGRRTMPARDEWAEVFRQTPIGVLVVGFLLLLVGAGLMLGGIIFLVSGRASAWPVWLVLFGAGPLAIYLALHFVWRRRWAWTTVVAMLMLALFTATVRALRAEVIPVAPISEIVVAGATLMYLLRTRVRQTFVE
jgi:hypothetical protein